MTAFDGAVYSLQFIACYSREYIIESSGKSWCLNPLFMVVGDFFFFKHLPHLIEQFFSPSKVQNC